MFNLKTILFLLLYFLSLNLLTAQEQLQHEQKMVRMPDGKIYVNKYLGAYLWISTSKDSTSQMYLLESERDKEYSNPFYFDTEGVNTIRSYPKVNKETQQPVYPKEDIAFDVYSDGYRPQSWLKFKNTGVRKKYGKFYCKKKCTVLMQAADGISGVDKIYYSINGAAYQPYIELIQLTEAKEYILTYYAVDNVGNVEKPQTTTIIIKP